eukprot:CAMPEP_0202710718 /NCGR_PEP_ID=MMETSP1385-20130828/22649_1 /ASSEMBLY_ACC=CAM_ASM_000861 /TAXON_ID=933848 /ORGANISM="Elphidium margaritaceum" /LENGTH=355 /DNA_ID=CAMNT_0049370313 /DNA_START=431 /DNA_END=1498 /DNA_ORIENTATION=-
MFAHVRSSRTKNVRSVRNKNNGTTGEPTPSSDKSGAANDATPPSVQVQVVAPPPPVNQTPSTSMVYCEDLDASYKPFQPFPSVKAVSKHSLAMIAEELSSESESNEHAQDIEMSRPRKLTLDAARNKSDPVPDAAARIHKSNNFGSKASTVRGMLPAQDGGDDGGDDGGASSDCGRQCLQLVDSRSAPSVLLIQTASPRQQLPDFASAPLLSEENAAPPKRESAALPQWTLSSTTSPEDEVDDQGFTFIDEQMRKNTKKSMRDHASEPLPEVLAYFDNPNNLKFEVGTHTKASPRFAGHASMPTRPAKSASAIKIRVSRQTSRAIRQHSRIETFLSHNGMIVTDTDVSNSLVSRT